MISVLDGEIEINFFGLLITAWGININLFSFALWNSIKYDIDLNFPPSYMQWFSFMIHNASLTFYNVIILLSKLVAPANLLTKKLSFL